MYSNPLQEKLEKTESLEGTHPNEPVMEHQNLVVRWFKLIDCIVSGNAVFTDWL